MLFDVINLYTLFQPGLKTFNASLADGLSSPFTCKHLLTRFTKAFSWMNGFALSNSLIYGYIWCSWIMCYDQNTEHSVSLPYNGWKMYFMVTKIWTYKNVLWNLLYAMKALLWFLTCAYTFYCKFRLMLKIISHKFFYSLYNYNWYKTTQN